MDYVIVGLIIFIISVVIIELAFFAYRNLHSIQRARIKKRLNKYIFIETDFGDILKKREYSTIPALNKILGAFSLTRNFDKLIIQSHSKHSVSFYIMLSMLLGLSGFIVSEHFIRNIPLAVLTGCILIFLPYGFLVNLKNRRVLKFQAQLHEGLDLVARALRAGHSFTSALSLASDEFGDPLGTEFKETLDEINFGVNVTDALHGLTERINCAEVKYFVIAVIIQRETGGNLAELMESLAHIIRERFVFEGKVRVLTAEGRISAVVLVGLPILIGAWLWVSNPDFLMPLFKNPIGHYMLIGAGVLLVLGMIVMKNMVKIEV